MNKIIWTSYFHELSKSWCSWSHSHGPFTYWMELLLGLLVLMVLIFCLVMLCLQCLCSFTYKSIYSLTETLTHFNYNWSMLHVPIFINTTTNCAIRLIKMRCAVLMRGVTLIHDPDSDFSRTQIQREEKVCYQCKGLMCWCWTHLTVKVLEISPILKRQRKVL